MVLFLLGYGCEAGFHISYKRTVKALKDGSADALLRKVKRSGFDCVILDFKTVRGEVGLPFDHPMLEKTKAFSEDIRPMAEKARRLGLYVIGRVTVFNDPLLFKTLGRGYKGFVFPDDTVVISYNRAVVEAVVPYVDEVQLDYVRWPDASVGVEVDERRRELHPALREILSVVPDSVPTSADIFGRIPFRYRGWWDRIGQDIFTYGEMFDILSPMAYPSHYWGILFKPYQAPYHTLVNMRMFGFPAERIRVWLQAFGWRVPKSIGLKRYILRQIEATYDAGVDLMMFWMPKNDTLIAAYGEWSPPEPLKDGEVISVAYRDLPVDSFLTWKRKDYGTVMDVYLMRGGWALRFWWSPTSRKPAFDDYPITVKVIGGDGVAFLYVREEWPWLREATNSLTLIYAGAWDVKDRKRNHTAIWEGEAPARVELLSDGERYTFRVLGEDGRVLARSRTFRLW